MKLALAIVASVSAQAAVAETAILSAPAAYEAMQTGDLILIDIRTPEEWAETGVAQGALALTMHSRDFGAKLTALFAAQPNANFGLICATGGRTSYVTSVLEKNGITGVVDVSEGMLGNSLGAGWVARDMPVVTADVAMGAYEQMIAK